MSFRHFCTVFKDKVKSKICGSGNMSDKSKKEKKKQDAKEKKSGDKLDKLQEEFEKLESQNEELIDKLQRLSADYANFQKRSPRQIAEAVAYEKKQLIRALLPSLDNFQHALENSHKAEDLDAVIKGIEMIFEHLLDALKSQGVKQIEAAGEDFDPSRHEAVMQRTEDDKADNVVLEQFQAGYMLNDEVLRPSKVIVNKKSLPGKETGFADRTGEDAGKDEATERESGNDQQENVNDQQQDEDHR